MLSRIKDLLLKKKYILFLRAKNSEPGTISEQEFTDQIFSVIIGHSPIDKTRWIIARVSVFPTVCKTGSPRDKLKLPGLN